MIRIYMTPLYNLITLFLLEDEKLAPPIEGGSQPPISYKIECI